MERVAIWQTKAHVRRVGSRCRGVVETFSGLGGAGPSG